METGFVGTWELDASQNDYQHGEPPQNGSYVIEQRGDELHFTPTWTDTSGQRQTVTFGGKPNGQLIPIDVPNVDGFTITFVDDNTLDSSTITNGEILAHARRVLAPDQQSMVVIQSGNRQDGTKYENKSVYLRKDRQATLGE